MSFDDWPVEARRWCRRCKRPTWQARDPYWEPRSLVGFLIWPFYWLVSALVTNRWECERCWKIECKKHTR